MIRLAKKSDLNVVLSLEQEGHGNEGYPYFFFAQCLDFLSNSFLVKVLDSHVIGFCLSAPSDRSEQTWILDLVITKEHQRKGFAEELMMTCIESSKEEIFLHVNPENKNAIALYKKIGFTIEETRKNFFGDGVDRLIMHMNKNTSNNR